MPLCHMTKGCGKRISKQVLIFSLYIVIYPLLMSIKTLSKICFHQIDLKGLIYNAVQYCHFSLTYDFDLLICILLGIFYNFILISFLDLKTFIFLKCRSYVSLSRDNNSSVEMNG